MPLSHAATYALRDLAAHYQVTETAAAEYAIGMCHWLVGHLKEGKHLWLADEEGNGGQHVELPPVKP